MCTAVSFRTPDLYVGRTLDAESTLGEEIVICPRHSLLSLRNAPPVRSEQAIIGIAHMEGDTPLWYDGMNRAGLCMAALRFPDFSARFPFPVAGRLTLTTFELIPWVLGSCSTVAEVRERLEGVILSAEDYSDRLPCAPLHWMLADERETVVLEQTERGLHLYDDPVQVLTNSPPLPDQLRSLTSYAALSPDPPRGTCLPGVEPTPFSEGLGSEGLPGGLSSPARFLRAAFTAAHALREGDADRRLLQCFHVMGSVEQVEGCCRTWNGGLERTQYTVCYDTKRLTCCYTTYENRQINAVSLRPAAEDGTGLVRYPLRHETDIRVQG